MRIQTYRGRIESLAHVHGRGGEGVFLASFSNGSKVLFRGYESRERLHHYSRNTHGPGRDPETLEAAMSARDLESAIDDFKERERFFPASELWSVARDTNAKLEELRRLEALEAEGSGFEKARLVSAIAELNGQLEASAEDLRRERKRARQADQRCTSLAGWLILSALLLGVALLALGGAA